MDKEWIIDLSSVYNQDKRLVKVLEDHPELRKKWLHKMVDHGWIEIVQFFNDEEAAEI